MGADIFQSLGLGRDVAAAFKAAHDNATWEYGHGGYSGTLAEKHNYIVVALPPRFTAQNFIHAMDWQPMRWTGKGMVPNRAHGDWESKARRQYNRLLEALGAKRMEQVYELYNDKWGPAVAIEITGTEATKLKKTYGRAGTRDKVFMFCGWASS